MSCDQGEAVSCFTHVGVLVVSDFGSEGHSGYGSFVAVASVANSC